MISVIVVNYHSAALTGRALASVLEERAAPPAELELLVVDNSEDAAEARRLRELLPPSARLLVNSVNEGFGQACNRAYEQSRGDLILLLNPDAWLAPGALDRLRRTLLDHPRAAAVGPLNYWDRARSFYLPPNLFPGPWQRLSRQLWRLHPALGWYQSRRLRRRALRVWRGNRALPQAALSGGGVLLRKSAVEAAGGLFDRRFFMYFEDSDLMLRLKRAGYRLYLEPAAACVHSYEHSAAKMALMARAEAEYYHKHHAGNPLLYLARLLEKRAPVGPPDNFVDLGPLSHPPALTVPAQWRDEWLLEISPSPFLMPAVGHFGRGAEARIPEECWRLLQSGDYYARLGPARPRPGSFNYWRWEIPLP